MKKICHISGTTLPGGGPEHIYQLSKRLNQNEWDIIICTLRDGYYWEKFNSIGVKTYNLILRKILLSTAFNLFRILQKEKPDIIHTHGKGPGLYGRIFGKILNIPVVHTFHGFHYEDYSFLKKILHLAVDTALAIITDQHIFVSTGEKNRAEVIYFLNEDNSTVIHNGVDHEYIVSRSIAKNEILKSIGCSDWEGKKLLGTISRISPEKGILNLMSAYSEVLSDIPSLRLLVVGGYSKEHKDYYLSVKKFIAKENLTEHVRILGYRNDALKILKCMDFYISPSLSEGLPISMLEALASGIPTIATEIAGNKDIVRNSVFGILVEPGLPKNLSQGICKMIKLPQRERDILSRNASYQIKKNFSIEEMARKTALLYKKILHKNGV